MKDKKGFTLIEVLAVIVILAVIAGLIIPNIKRYKDKGNKEYYNKLKDNIVLAVKDYYSNHPEELPRGQIVGDGNDRVKISATELNVNDLISNNYLTNEIVDTQGKSCVKTESKVVVKNTNGNYTYTLCDFCDGILANESSNDCKVNNTYNYCTVNAVATSDPTEKELTVLTYGYVDVKVEVGEGVTARDGKYYVNESGTYTFTVKSDDSADKTLGSCSYTLYIKDDKEPTCKIVQNGPSLDIIVSDNYRISSVKNNMNNENTTYSCKTKDGGIISKSATIQTGIDISKLTVKTIYNATVTDCAGNSHVCTKEIDPTTYDDPTICKDGATTKGYGFTKCDATCVNGSWQCNEDSSCTEGWKKSGTPTPCYGTECGNCKYQSPQYVCTNGKWVETGKYTYSSCDSTDPTPDTRECKYPGECDKTCTTYGGSQYRWCCSTDYKYYKKYDCEEYNPPSGCFVKGTKILTSTGYKNIEDIKVGDIVKSLNLETGKVEYKPVYIKYVFDDLTQELYTLKVNWETIKVTGAHNFFVKNSNNSIIAKAAKDLKIGDLIIDENGLTYPITEISYKKSNDVVYNFAVRDNHNYFVGEKGYLVHNQDEDGKVLSYCSGSDSSLVGKSCTGGVWDQKIQGTCIKVYCKKKSGGCFTLGTKVLTPTGYKNIEYLHLGDKVMSYNTQTKQMEVDVVTNTFIFNDLMQQIYDISTSNGMFTVSKQHRFYVKVNENLVLKTAGELNVGDILVNDKNEEIEITSINSYTSSIPVYNIEVLKNHNYYVTENNILTHNMSLQYGFNILASDDRSNQFK